MKREVPTPTRRQSRLMVVSLVLLGIAGLVHVAVRLTSNAADVVGLADTAAFITAMTYCATSASVCGAGTKVSWWRFYLSSDGQEASALMVTSWFRARWYVAVARGTGWPVALVFTIIVGLLVPNVVLYVAYHA